MLEHRRAQAAVLVSICLVLVGCIGQDGSAPPPPPSEAAPSSAWQDVDRSVERTIPNMTWVHVAYPLTGDPGRLNLTMLWHLEDGTDAEDGLNVLSLTRWVSNGTPLGLADSFPYSWRVSFRGSFLHPWMAHAEVMGGSAHVEAPPLADRVFEGNVTMGWWLDVDTSLDGYRDNRSRSGSAPDVPRPVENWVFFVRGPGRYIEPGTVEGSWHGSPVSLRVGTEREDIVFRRFHEGDAPVQAGVRTPAATAYASGSWEDTVTFVEEGEDRAAVFMWRPPGGSSGDSGYQRPDGTDSRFSGMDAGVVTQAGPWRFWWEGGATTYAHDTHLVGTAFDPAPPIWQTSNASSRSVEQQVVDGHDTAPPTASVAVGAVAGLAIGAGRKAS